MTADANNPAASLVTGGASGLGAAVVEAVLKAGGTPVVLDRDISNVSGVKAFEVDVADRLAVEAAVREAAEIAGRPGRRGHRSRHRPLRQAGRRRRPRSGKRSSA